MAAMGFPLIVLLSLSVLVVPSLLLQGLKRILAWKKGSAGKVARFPGPKQYPFIGRVHDLDRGAAWLKFKEWAEEFGPIYQTSMLGQKFIIISDENIAQDILIKQGNNFAGRAQIQALMDHKQGPVYVALQDRHETWVTQRKWVHAAMAAAYSQHFHGHIEREVKRYLVALLVDPAKFQQNTRELTGRITCTLTWDDASQGKRYGDDALETLARMSLKGPIVNAVPQLWHLADFFRYNPWRKFEVARQARQRASWLGTLQNSKKRFLRGELPSDTYAYRYFQQLIGEGNPTLQQSHKDEDFAACMLGFQCLVAIVTLSGPFLYFLMSMSLHPEWQKKAQEEIDRVCGDRMPGLGDFAALPTVRACLKESMRWRSNVPLGVPHRCEASTEFMGVPIEEDTIILACEWNINRVKEKYPDPEIYHPERWLEPGWPTYMAPLSQYPNLREGHAMHTFGWGRRTCLGKSLADDELFLAASAVCWGFNMSVKKDPKTGKDMEFDSQATNSSVILEPKPWPMDFEPRSEERAKLMLQKYSEICTELKT